jgi:hypothetical protein
MPAIKVFHTHVIIYLSTADAIQPYQLTAYLNEIPLALQMGHLQFLSRNVVEYVTRGREMAFLRLLTDMPLSLAEFTYFIVCLLGSVHKTSYCFIPISKY